MRKLREVLRLKHEQGLSNRKIGISLKISHVTVAEYLRRAERAGLGWPLGEEWSRSPRSDSPSMNGMT
jgi:transposase